MNWKWRCFANAYNNNNQLLWFTLIYTLPYIRSCVCNTRIHKRLLLFLFFYVIGIGWSGEDGVVDGSDSRTVDGYVFLLLLKEFLQKKPKQYTHHVHETIVKMCGVIFLLLIEIVAIILLFERYHYTIWHMFHEFDAHNIWRCHLSKWNIKSQIGFDCNKLCTSVSVMKVYVKSLV